MRNHERHSTDLSNEPFQVGEWLIDPSANQAKKGNAIVTVVPKDMAVLIYMAQNAGRVIARDELFSNIWKDVVVGENAIYHHIAQLRKLFEDSTAAPVYIETIPKKGYRLIADVRILNAEENGQEKSSEKYKEASPLSSIPALINRKKFLISSVVVLIFLSVYKFGYPPIFTPVSEQQSTEEQTHSISSLAVLSFRNITNPPEQNYFAEGLADALIQQLSHLSQLRVLARASSFGIENTEHTLPYIRQKLGVDAVLTGSIQQSSNTHRIIVQLVRTKDGSHLWSRSFDYINQDIFTIQDAISTSVAAAMRLQFKRNVPSNTISANKTAYDNYLRGQYHLNRKNQESLKLAESYFSKSIQQDPRYANAYVGLSETYQAMPNFAGWEKDRALALAEEAILKALSLSPQLGEAHASFAGLKFQLGDLLAAENAYKKAIELSPNYAPGYHGYGGLLNTQGRYNEAYEMVQKAVVLDPLSVSANYTLVWIMYEIGLFEDAEAQLQTAFELMPDSTTKYLQKNWSKGNHLEDLQDFMDWYKLNAPKIQNVDANFASFAMIGQLWLDLNDSQKALHWIAKAETLASDEYFTNISLANLAYFEGNYEKTRYYFRQLQTLAPSNKLGALFNGFAEVLMENYPAAQTLLLEVFPAFSTPYTVTIDRNNYRVAVNFAKVLMELGRAPEANGLLEKLNLYFQQRPIDHANKIDISDVETLALLGKVAEANTLLRQAVDQGWMPNHFKMMPMPDKNPMLAGLTSTAEFQETLNQIHSQQQHLSLAD